MLYILYGQDEFSLSESLAQVKGGLGDPELLATSTTVFAGQRLSLPQLTAACDTVPFLAPARLVIVEGLLGRFEPVGRGRGAKVPPLGDWAGLKEYAGRMPPSTVLVLLESALRKDNPLLRDLSRVAEVREFPLLRGARLQSWVQQRVAAAGGAILPRAAWHLGDLVGGNLRLLSQEIEKLTLYAQSRPISEEDVDALVASAREASVFAMVDAILERRPTVAARLCHRLLHQEGETVVHLMVMITRQVRMLLLAKELLAQRAAPSEVAQSLGISQDFVLKKTLEQAERHSMRQLKEAYHRLLETDVSIKTGRLGGDLALDLLVAELSRSG